MFTLLRFILEVAGPAEAKLNWSGRVHDWVHKHAAARVSFEGMPPKDIFQIWCSKIASEAIFGPFFSLIWSSWQASTMAWLVCYAIMWLHIVLPSFPDPGSTKQLHKRRTLQPWPNYATLVWHPQYLVWRRQAHTSLACMSMWLLEKSQKLVRPWPEQPDWLCQPWVVYTEEGTYIMACVTGLDGEPLWRVGHSASSIRDESIEWQVVISGKI